MLILLDAAMVMVRAILLGLVMLMIVAEGREKRNPFSPRTSNRRSSVDRVNDKPEEQGEL